MSGGESKQASNEEAQANAVLSVTLGCHNWESFNFLSYIGQIWPLNPDFCEPTNRTGTNLTMGSTRDAFIATRQVGLSRWIREREGIFSGQHATFINIAQKAIGFML